MSVPDRGGFFPGSRLQGAAVALAALAVYLPALGAGFVWDDLQYVQMNPLLRDVRGLERIWSDPQASPQYYPLTFSTFWFEYRLWGLSARGYHATNLILHAANALLLFRLLVGLRIRGSFAVALLFAVHPLRVESVAWISERKDVLSGVFFLAALLIWRRYRILGDLGSYLAALALFAAGLLSKVAICPLPLVLLLWEWWERGKISFPVFLKTIPFFLLALGFGVLHILLEEKNIGTARAAVDLPAAERTILAGRAFWFYVFKTFWPYPLMPIHPAWEIDARDASGFLFPLSMVGVFAFLWWGRKRFGRGPIAALGFYLVMIGPVLGFASQAFYRFSYVAEHFQYLAGVGILALAVGAGIGGLERVKAAKYLGAAACGIAVLVLGAMTWRQTLLWNNSETLFAHNLRHNPDSWGVHTALGAILLAGPGELEKALAHLETAAILAPDQPQAHYNLGVARASAGRFEEAIASYREAVCLEPEFPPALNNLGIALEEVGRYEEAIENYDRALELDPEFLQAADNRAKARLRMKALQR